MRENICIAADIKVHPYCFINDNLDKTSVKCILPVDYYHVVIEQMKMPGRSSMLILSAG